MERACSIQCNGGSTPKGKLSDRLLGNNISAYDATGICSGGHDAENAIKVVIVM